MSVMPSLPELRAKALAIDPVRSAIECAGTRHDWSPSSKVEQMKRTSLSETVET